ncbi:Amidase enzyme [Teratosphaeria destructans]|uniref:Amidase enzyme n=1 Tax=Teratosphaeria destructans TaxID=418781 RepID=A0A9W7SUY3_9PEZI|nr:Amidase enzyme [Teratosphaeria destructans]
MDWQETGRVKRESIKALLPECWRLPSIPSAEDVPNGSEFSKTVLTEREVHITEHYTARTLLQALSSGSLSAVETIDAFCHRATIAHELTNCLSEVMFESALNRAKELDQYYQAHGKPIGPLHGLPISLKDQFRVEGTETSLGYVSWLGETETAESESWLVTKLRSLGAIFYCKTNVPTSLMAIETNNNIIGYTTNALDRRLSSGGSSGGEASLLAMRGSASIRQPCAYSDLVGLKPSSGRMPYLRVANSMEGQQIVPSVIGPMAHTIEDLRLLFKTVLQLEPWTGDPSCLPIPWQSSAESEARRKIAAKTLTLGILRSDGVVRPHPPVSRAMDEAAALLRANGIRLIDWHPPPHTEAFQILWSTFALDSGTEIHTHLQRSHEPPIPELAISYGSSPAHLPPRTLHDAWALQTRKQAFQRRYNDYWRSTGVDAVLGPVRRARRIGPGRGRYFGYTGVWTYDPEVFHGMPVGLQLVCQRLEEEKLLAIAEEVQRILLTPTAPTGFLQLS